MSLAVFGLLMQGCIALSFFLGFFLCKKLLFGGEYLDAVGCGTGLSFFVLVFGFLCYFLSGGPPMSKPLSYVTHRDGQTYPRHQSATLEETVEALTDHRYGVPPERIQMILSKLSQ